MEAGTLQAAEALYAEVEAENAKIASARPELSATMAGESRCLRTILHTVLKDMAKQIA
jgi:serine/threonine-protein kinase HipA